MGIKMEEIRKELMELREELTKVEYRLRRLEVELSYYSKEELKNELKKEYPEIEFDDDLLELVGTHPYNPIEKDKEVIRETIERLIK